MSAISADWRWRGKRDYEAEWLWVGEVETRLLDVLGVRRRVADLQKEDERLGLRKAEVPWIAQGTLTRDILSTKPHGLVPGGVSRSVARGTIIRLLKRMEGERVLTCTKARPARYIEARWEIAPSYAERLAQVKAGHVRPQREI